MNTLKDHLILYDAECPMCQAYTKAFTATGMLDARGRAPYQETPDSVCPFIDPVRAVNEIALVNRNTGEVSYGIDSLFRIIGHSFPVLGPLFRCRPFRWCMRKLYAFISYNRKVIIPPPKQPVHAIQPSFRLSWRIAWLVFTVCITGYILTAYAKLLPGIIPAGNPYREYWIAAGQLLWQGSIAVLIAPRKIWDYLGNMMTISLAGSLLLLPALAIIRYTHASPVWAGGWFLLVAGAMLAEHIRRTRLLSLCWYLSVTWVFYRLAILYLIFAAAGRI